MSKQKKLSVPFQIVDLKLDSITITDQLESYSKESNIMFLLTPETGINLEEKLFIVKTKFSMTNEDKDLLICSAECTMVFKLPMMDKIIKIIDDKPDIEEGLSRHLIGIVISTLRGILYLKFQGTPLDGFILPAIQLSKFKKL